MCANHQKVVFVSLTDAANGAENVLRMAAEAIDAPILFLKKVHSGGLSLMPSHNVRYITNKSLIIGFLGLVSALQSYRKHYIIISTHPYLNAYLGFLKQIGFLQSQLIVRECTSVFSRYSGFKKITYALAYRLGYPAVNMIICQTALMRNQFLSYVTYITPKKVIVIENPVDLLQVINKARAPVNDADIDANFICAAGRLIPEKGFDVLIKSFKNIEAEYPGLKLYILGEGPEREALNGLINEHHLAEKIILKGRISNPMPYFKRACLCIVSSVKEGFPNVLLEMMTLNSNVVSTTCAGGIEAIPGILTAQPDNEQSLTASIKKALIKSPEITGAEVQQYLQNKKPDAYINAILHALNRQTLLSSTIAL